MERSHIYGVELSRLRNLCSEPQPLRTIHFRLESDTLPVRDSYLDLYVPEFHKYGSSTDRPVRHLDITSIWRKLSTAQAEELKFWEEMFAAVLEYTVSNHLIDLVDDMDDCNIDRFPGDLDGRICSFINKQGGKTFPVNVREVINCMLELYKRHGCQHQWLASSGNFYNALCEFLRTRDCFLDAPLHPTIKVTFSASLSGRNEPIVVGVLRRFGPVMGFSRLDAFTREQAWCHIHPAYMEPALDPRYALCLGRPEYRLASDWVKFDWDTGAEGFRGYVRPVPVLGETGVCTCLNVDLAVVSKRFFPGEIVFERNLRVKIKLSVSRIIQLPTASSSLFIPSPELQDLGKVMKANKRSPTKPKDPFWATDSPAWEIMPDYVFSPAQVNRKRAPGSRPRTSCLGRSLSDVFEDAEQFLLSQSTLPRPVRVQLRSSRSESSLPLKHAASTMETSDDEYAVVQAHQSCSSSDIWEMKQIKEWYDAMCLKRDTPCKKTREEISQEEAFQEAFLGYDGDE